jgi:NAD(P)-dependent dehydrogenase (short-subunit alcohol dehydrogenase family)
MSTKSTAWGATGTSTFTPTSHSTVNATIDPTKATLPKPFVVCIIGASRGIGASIATAYTKAGATSLVLAARRISGLETTASECRAINPSVEIEIVPCDITSASSVEALASKTKERFNRLDVAVVNSGYSGPVVLKVTETDAETFQNASNVNYIGTFLCAKYLIPILLSTPKGAKSFIGVSSFAALIVRGPIANSQYCVSKMAQLKLLEHIHEEFHSEGLASYAIHPGAVMSEMADESAPEEFRKFLTDSSELCGAYCVWLTKDEEQRKWLSGRLISAKWDADELEARKEESVEKGLLKTVLTV